MTPPDQQAELISARERILSLMAKGWTQRRIANALDRSPDYVSRIVRNKTPGHGVAESLGHLDATGKTTPPPRRTKADGSLAKVRGSSTTGSVVPTGPAAKAAKLKKAPAVSPRKTTPQPKKKARPKKRSRSKSTDQPTFTKRGYKTKQNRFTHESDISTKTGREYHRITAPKGSTSWNRWEAADMLGEIVDKAAKRLHRLHATVWVQQKGDKERRAIKLGGKGGYDAQLAMQQINSHENAFEWFRDQVADRYPEFAYDDLNWTVVGVDLDIW